MKSWSVRMHSIFMKRTYQAFQNMAKRANKKKVVLPFDVKGLRDHVALMVNAQQGGWTVRCLLCGNIVTVDDLVLAHVMPLSRGGLWDLSNIGAAHDHCNRIQGELKISEYQVLMQLLANFPEAARKDVTKRLKTAGGFSRMRYFPKGPQANERSSSNRQSTGVLPGQAPGTATHGRLPKAKFGIGEKTSSAVQDAFDY